MKTIWQELTTLAALGATTALAWHGTINGEAAVGVIAAVIGWKAGVASPTGAP